MSFASFVTLARTSQLTVALVLTGCLPELTSDPQALTSDEQTDTADTNERKRKNMTLYVEPVTNASVQADLWAVSDPVGAARMEEIAAHQIGIWLGDWIADVALEVDDAVTRAGSSLQTLVVYNIPNRDCGFWSAGGAADAAEYTQFIEDIAIGLNGRPAIVILEPDGLALEDCLTIDQVIERESLMAAAVDTLTASGARVYIDAGDSNWIPSADMAVRLAAAGVANAAGFALNVSHTETTVNESAFAEELRVLLGTDAHYIVDTSRNGIGPTVDNQWCNPLGRSLGAYPTLDTGVVGMDAMLWVKPPGESDGECNGGPPAGGWWPEYAEELAVVAGI